MAVEITPKLEKLFHEEKIAWLTTVRGDGMPVPAPMWFLWRDGCFLMYSQPDARRIHNIVNNPRVAINLNTDLWGNRVVVVTGIATIESGAEPASEVPPYIEKYREGMMQIGTTPGRMAQEYSTAIYVRPAWLRYE